jgi:hypothetical protein
MLDLIRAFFFKIHIPIIEMVAFIKKYQDAFLGQNNQKMSLFSYVKKGVLVRIPQRPNLHCIVRKPCYDINT